MHSGWQEVQALSFEWEAGDADLQLNGNDGINDGWAVRWRPASSRASSLHCLLPLLLLCHTVYNNACLCYFLIMQGHFPVVCT
jgi:hypothetical protein